MTPSILRCGKCHQERPAEEFPSDPYKKRGKRQVCLDCEPYTEHEKWRMCGRKIGYRSRDTALSAQMKMARKAAVTRAYKCPVCPKWHLTTHGEKEK